MTLYRKTNDIELTKRDSTMDGIFKIKYLSKMDHREMNIHEISNNKE